MAEVIIEFKQKGVLDRVAFLTEPYFWLIEPKFDLLIQAVNILAIDRGIEW